MDTNRHFRSVVLGEGALALSCADIILNRGHTISGIISSDPLIQRFAADKGIPRLEPSGDWQDQLGAWSFEFLFSIGYLRVVPERVLNLAPRGAINFHNSLLPRYAGLNATSWALMDRVTHHGVTWHFMTGRVDAGDILKQRRIEVTSGETAFSLNKKCLEAGMVSFTELIDDLGSGSLRPLPQDLSARTEYGRFSRPANACVLDWRRNAEELDAFIRALDFGNYPNPLGLPKAKIGGEWMILPEVRVLPTASTFPPGTIVAITSDAIGVATGSHDVEIRKAITLEGEALQAAQIVSRFDLRERLSLELPDAHSIERLAALTSRTCRHEEAWISELSGIRPLDLADWMQPGLGTGATERESVRLAISNEPFLTPKVGPGEDNPGETMLAALGCFFASIRDEYCFDIGFSETRLQEELSGFERLFATHVPFRFDLDPQQSFEQAVAAVRARLASVRKLRTFARDIVLRYPSLNSERVKRAMRFPVAIEFGTDDHDRPGSDSDVVIRLSENGEACTWSYSSARISRKAVTNLARQFATFLRQLAADPSRPVGDISLLSDAQRHELLFNWNSTAAHVSGEQCQHELFERQTEQSPDRTAVVFQDQELSFRELNARANQLAHSLKAKGVGPGRMVGIFMSRSLEMMVALLGTLKAGAAYVPLDPSYPQERLAFVVEDAQIALVIAQPQLIAELPPSRAEIFTLDSTWKAIAEQNDQNVVSGVKPDDLAYVLYTSGSTGKPKGVMVEHRNVVNFFAGMDRSIGNGVPGTWLAVTSISFDISILELFWTLTRGFKVVIQPEQSVAMASLDRTRPRRQAGAAARKIDFSLSYFASDEGSANGEKYRLLLEGAKFADQNGFAAIWTPERHFHAFGGLYPNPSITSAAVAAVTKRIQIRAGSVVLPLHSPVRVAEEWAVVDNISQGRIGISFASGWHANDFVLAPDNYRESKAIMLREIETVRKLWRGEALAFRNGKGEEVPIRTLPRPVQRELPVWITAAGNPETFRVAGQLGTGLLTHLLGQSIEALAEKIALYRDAWRQQGHTGRGQVTLMLHTYVGESIEAVREKVRAPFSGYLRSSVDLIKNAPSAFPTLKKAPTDSTLDDAMKSGTFDQADMEALVAHAFDRYFETSALFGTPESCLQMITRLKEIGVDEVACLIDFGVDSESVLSGLSHLKRVMELSAEKDNEPQDFSIPAQVFRHKVTHFQCTPSMARMLLAEDRGPEALGAVQKILLGGEQLSPALVQQLKPVVKGQIFNMYGPTETTIWSTVARVDPESERVHIGRPIVNTEIYILNRRLQPVPIGMSGELFIGGAGVARGYLNRGDLTTERFIKNPFRNDPDARLYRTGDLARYLPDGNIEFLGRVDNQVKIRGHRIEVREIELALEQHPAVREAVVTTQSDDAENKRLAAYLVAASRDGQPGLEELRRHLQSKLPEYMMPQAFAWLEAMPLTPNGKLDRRALPNIDSVRSKTAENFVAASSPLEKQLATIWAEELGLERVGMHDNFFNLGGNSLLAVQIAFKIRQRLGVHLPLNTFFDLPTIAGLGQRLEESLLEQAEDSKLEALLAEIESLSDEQLKSAETATPTELLK